MAANATPIEDCLHRNTQTPGVGHCCAAASLEQSANAEQVDHNVGGRAGTLYLGNTLGNVAGSLATGFLLLPWLGMQGTALVLARTGAVTLRGEETRLVFEEGVGPVPVTVRARAGIPAFAQLSAAMMESREMPGVTSIHAW